MLRDQAQYGKLRGIVNGIDYLEWNPEVDKFLTDDGYANYTVETLKEGKAKCKAALQKVITGFQVVMAHTSCTFLQWCSTMIKSSSFNVDPTG